MEGTKVKIRRFSVEGQGQITSRVHQRTAHVSMFVCSDSIFHPFLCISACISAHSVHVSVQRRGRDWLTVGSTKRGHRQSADLERDLKRHDVANPLELYKLPEPPQ